MIIGYPYSYGDQKESDIFDSILEVPANRILIAILGVVMIPTICHAKENYTIPQQLINSLTLKDNSTAVGPVSAICCASMGYCARVAHCSYKKGEIQTTTVAVCATLASCCAQRVAQYYQI